eukprot:798434_1
MPDDIKNIINDENWWTMVGDVVSLLNPLDMCLVQLETDFLPLSEAYYRYHVAWNKYRTENFTLFREDKLGNRLREHIDDLFDDKWCLLGHCEDEDAQPGINQIGLRNATHAAVFLIDTRYKNKLGAANGVMHNFDRYYGEQVLKKWAGQKWDEEVDGDHKMDNDDMDDNLSFRTIFTHYMNGTGIFADDWIATRFGALNEHSKIGEVLDAYTFLASFTEYSDYANWCIKLLKINGQTVDVERSFSGVRIIHTERRRNMTSDHLADLVYCYWNTRALEKDNVDTYKLCLSFSL